MGRRGRHLEDAAPDAEALPAVARVDGSAVTPLNREGARVSTEPLVEAATLAARMGRRIVAESSVPDGGVRLLLAAPSRGGAQVLALNLTWVLDPARLGQVAPRLTAREREVLLLLVQGHGPDRVAELLGITWHTARTHVRNVYRALDLTDRAGVARLGLSLVAPRIEGWAPAAEPPG